MDQIMGPVLMERNTRKEGVDYEKTFSLVVRFASIRFTMLVGEDLEHY